MKKQTAGDKATTAQGEATGVTTGGTGEGAVCTLPPKTETRGNLIKQKKQGAGIKTIAIIGFDANGDETELIRTGHRDMAIAVAELACAEGRFPTIAIRG